MNAIRQVFDTATTQLHIDLPPELQHRRLEVIVLPLDEETIKSSNSIHPRYQTLEVSERLLSQREDLYEH
ncbi:hypothetical protein SAMN05421644_12410 [Allochromatium warmingii]|uniref:Uncharacterized protein n=1 Tax=Allochromatium warmingii TaxID=61595 RepID=A0A1H3GCP5_ALLWA|nr:hypothetical protein [Allochromatium warmingii]SDY00820.1 hypothetical protein SAMN05421644_12410 [Allochromatium warmingii]